MASVKSPYEQDQPGGLVWIEEGKQFDFDELVFFHGKGEIPFEQAAAKIDLILTGPHASAAIPRELQPFLKSTRTQREQYDFSDVSTSNLCKRWVEIDEHALYIEFPHHRILFDANREWPTDPEAGLREYFKRRESQKQGEKVSYNGVDAIRPISFGGVPFLRQPADDVMWQQLMSTVIDLGTRGAKTYTRIRDQVIEQVFEAKCRYLYNLDMAQVTVAEFNSACMLHVNCVHDTMNATISPNGAIDRDKSPNDCLPRIVSFGNRGDKRGDPRPPGNGAIMPLIDVPTIDGAQLRSLIQAMIFAFQVPQAEIETSLAMNSPYLGAFECQYIGRLLHALEPRGIVRHNSDEKMLNIRTGAYQSEFSRELLLGRKNTAHVRQPGKDWPNIDQSHHGDLAARLKQSYDILRRWCFDIPPIITYQAPRFR